MPIPLLLAGLGLVIAAFAYAWWQSASVGRHPHCAPTPAQMGLGAATLFFDTLGIGNYAPATAAFRFMKMVRDEYIPGTLNVGSSIPVAIEAFAFVAAIAVDPTTLMVLVPMGARGVRREEPAPLRDPLAGGGRGPLRGAVAAQDGPGVTREPAHRDHGGVAVAPPASCR